MTARLDSPDDVPAHWKQALAIVAVAALVRLFLASILPLVADEAYYWEWSRRLAGGYFDHPPAIAWLVAGGTALFGDTPFGVRFLPVLVGGVGALALVGAVRQLAGNSAARFAAVLLAAMPISAFGLVLATPDAPLLGAVGVTIYAVANALAAEPFSWRALLHWLLAGLAIGLAMTSKFTGVLVPIGVALAVVAIPSLRSHLRAPGPWLAVSLASLVMMPVLHWNAQNEWIAFRFQFAHGLGTAARGSWWSRELELVGGQLGLVSPILCVLFVASAVRALRAPKEPVRAALAIVALFCAAFFAFSATRKPVEANWPALAWLPALVLLAARRAGPRTRWERRGVALAIGISGIVLAQALLPFLPIPAARDPLARGHGWSRVASEVDNVGKREYAASGEVHLAANRYQDAALLAFHVNGHPTTYALNIGARPNQYDLWQHLHDHAAPGASLVLLLPASPPGRVPPVIAELEDHFVSYAFAAPAVLERAGEVIAERGIWVLRGWDGSWPAHSPFPILSTSTRP